VIPAISSPIPAPIPPKNDIPYSSQYIVQTAKEYGINPIDALFIIGKESQDCVNLSGDDGISIGYWMFNLKANPQVSYSCASNFECSTNLAMKWISEGKINAWSTWRFRCKWYADAPDCPVQN
jgi:hypothetical protein